MARMQDNNLESSEIISHPLLTQPIQSLLKMRHLINQAIQSSKSNDGTVTKTNLLLLINDYFS